jgi:hypothetical protein
VLSRSLPRNSAREITESAPVTGFANGPS